MSFGVEISIHAPQWGATTRRAEAAATKAISIHAPQWGATSWRRTEPHAEHDFNPRTPVGCDARVVVHWYADAFQSTHPSGVRPHRRSTVRIPSYFNPRTPVGCDRPVRHSHGRNRHISIHAPQWGATDTVNVVWAYLLFQSTHPSGVRQVDAGTFVPKDIFQSTHPSGVRLGIGYADSWRSAFQSTHPSGVRPTGTSGVSQTNSFQSTHPSGVRLLFNWSNHVATVFQSTHPSGVRPGCRPSRSDTNLFCFNVCSTGSAVFFRSVG